MARVQARMAEVEGEEEEDHTFYIEVWGVRGISSSLSLRKTHTPRRGASSSASSSFSPTPSTAGRAVSSGLSFS